MDENIRKANAQDAPALAKLINSAYRGEHAKKGWTHEADLIDGALRTNVPTLQQIMEKEEAAILKYVEHDQITGCVYLEKKGDKMYLGMLTVSPDAQAKGTGKKLLSAADEFARNNNCRFVEMTVISVRHELIAWYERNGYKKTGRTEPFPDDNRFGIPRQPIEFVVMEKEL